MGALLSALVAALVSVKAARHARLHAPAKVALASVPDDAGRLKVARTTGGKVSAAPPSMLHLDPRHTNRSPFAGPVSPTLAWTFDTGGPIEAAPVVLDDGTIVVAS